MTRRTRLMLVVVLGAVAALGAVKTRQIQAMVAQASSFQPPPEAVTTTVAREEPWPTTHLGDRNGEGRARSGAERRPAGRRRVAGLRLRPRRPGRRGAGAARRAAGTRAARGRRGAAGAREGQPRSRRRARGAGDPGGGRARPRERGAQAGRGARRRDPRHDRAQADPRSLRRRAGDPAGGPRPVPEGRRPDRAAAVARPDLRELLGAAAAGGRDGGRPRGARHGGGQQVRRERRADHRGRLGRGRGDAQRAGAGDARQPARRAASGDVRRDVRGDRRARQRGGAAGLGDQLRAVRRLRLSWWPTRRDRRASRPRPSRSSS